MGGEHLGHGEAGVIDRDQLTEALEMYDAHMKRTGYLSPEGVAELAEAAHILADIMEAIDNEGPKPRYHREVMKRHRKQWPSLWAAIDKAYR